MLEVEPALGVIVDAALLVRVLPHETRLVDGGLGVYVLDACAEKRHAQE